MSQSYGCPRQHPHSCSNIESFPFLMFFAVLQRKHVRLAIKIAYLKAAAEDLRFCSSPLQFNRSDAIMIKIACAQAGSVSIKVHKSIGTSASEAMMREVEQLCDSIAGDTDALLHEAHAESVFYRL